jgi:predicted PurR-regulated permease PerM
MLKKKEGDQTLRTVLVLVLVGVVGLLIWKLSDVIILIITAAILAATLAPLVKWLEQRLSKKIAEPYLSWVI